MSFVDERKALTREKRLSTLSHYNGTFSGLKDETGGTEILQKIRTYSEIGKDEIIAVEQTLSKIDGIAVIVHGAVGCSASGSYYYREKPFNWYTTGLNERDTILGGDTKLSNAVRKAYDELNPDAIFIVGTPVVAINNDDVASVILELEDELDVPIIHVETDGFKSKNFLTGYDVLSHALLRNLVDREKGENPEKKDFLNVISFSENKGNIDATLSILEDLGIPYNLFPQYGNVDNIRRASEARASIVLDRDEGAYFASQLEEVYGVTYIHSLPPIARLRINSFVKKIAKIFDITDKATEYLKEKNSRIDSSPVGLFLSGKTVFLDTELDKAVGLSEFVQRSGGTVAGVAVTDIDTENRKYLNKISSIDPSATAIVGTGQIFEKANALSKHPVDYYISTEGTPSFADAYGAIPVDLTHSVYYGYTGIGALCDAIQGSVPFSYSPENHYKASWLRKSGNWYVKQEVK